MAAPDAMTRARPSAEWMRDASVSSVRARAVDDWTVDGTTGAPGTPERASGTRARARGGYSDRYVPSRLASAGFRGDFSMLDACEGSGGGRERGGGGGGAAAERRTRRRGTRRAARGARGTPELGRTSARIRARRTGRFFAVSCSGTCVRRRRTA